MSRMEYNKGELTLSSMDEVLQKYPEASVDDLEWETDQEYVQLNGEIYKVKWEVNRGDEPDVPELIQFHHTEEGSIKFTTYHYNGGANWTEIVEKGFKGN